MPSMKKSAKTKAARARSKRAMADAKNALKTNKKLQLELSKVKKHLSDLVAFHYFAP
jgi:hypothetical protein